MPNPAENGFERQQPSTSIWLTEPSAAAVEMGSLAGYDTVVLDIEHGLFDLRAVDWIIPLIRAKGMRVIAKVLGPERGPIQQALDFGADAVAIPHITSADHAARICGFAKFPPLGDRSFAGGRTSGYRGFTDDWVSAQDRNTQCYPMIEDASAFDDIEEILALPVVDGIFIGPSDLSLRRDRGAYGVTTEDLADIRHLARAANAAGKPWLLPAWSAAEQRLAVEEGAHTIVAAMQYGAMLAGFTATMQSLQDITADVRSAR
ncbi:4-hydroxy-2-oxovalerate aldolase [Mycolicibacterium sp. S2-37]|uniref:HpcH/HpaI aldolase family protein n=1 Tax=Mycolicibacterium sp. S2-37 TaxID=2810297 RepID=UPI001A942ADD|nr:aldolase/citrate lyase family protein [Mycolicibacterium sp. S2-37]MBO0676550.1 4-hydroxy-2-oxovalerate aldolase [Mycolicibacterium sp. S2-37]